jgi:hypothetical protein
MLATACGSLCLLRLLRSLYCAYCAYCARFIVRIASVAHIASIALDLLRLLRLLRSVYCAYCDYCTRFIALIVVDSPMPLPELRPAVLGIKSGYAQQTVGPFKFTVVRACIMFVWQGLFQTVGFPQAVVEATWRRH